MSIDPLQLELVLPGLFGPLAGQSASGFPEPDWPALAELTARGRLSRQIDRGPALIYTLFGYACAEQLDTPDAWLSYQIDTGQVPTAPLLLAAPVHLRADRSRLVLFDADSVGIEAGEAAALVEALNADIRDRHWRLEASRANRWYLHLPQAPQLHCTALNQVLGQDIDPHLPSGVDAKRWHAYLNELQMRLHDTPINRTREAQGRSPLNSLWLWGGGAPLERQAQVWQRLWADDPVTQGLARLNAVPCEPVPASAADWLRQVVGDRHLLVDERLVRPLAYGDIEAWLARVEALDRLWFQPLREALRKGRLRKLIVHAGAGLRLDIDRWTVRRFWRRPTSALLTRVQADG